VTVLDVDAEHPLEALRPPIVAGRSAVVGSSVSLEVFSEFPWPRLPGVCRARCLLLGANTPGDRFGFTPGPGIGAASRAVKSSGSKMMCVVPSRYGVLSEWRMFPAAVTGRRFSGTAGLIMCTLWLHRGKDMSASCAARSILNTGKGTYREWRKLSCLAT